MINKRNRILIYLKIFITTLFFVYTGNIIFILFQKLSNAIFNTTFILDYNLYNFSVTIPFYLFLSLFMLSQGIYITKGVRIEDMETELEKVKNVMNKLSWKLIEADGDTFVFRSPFIIGLWMDDIIVEFTGNELHFTGPRKYVNNAIARGKYPYAAYEIKTKVGG